MIFILPLLLLVAIAFLQAKKQNRAFILAIFIVYIGLALLLCFKLPQPLYLPNSRLPLAHGLQMAKQSLYSLHPLANTIVASLVHICFSIYLYVRYCRLQTALIYALQPFLLLAAWNGITYLIPCILILLFMGATYNKNIILSMLWLVALLLTCEYALYLLPLYFVFSIAITIEKKQSFWTLINTFSFALILLIFAFLPVALQSKNPLWFMAEYTITFATPTCTSWYPKWIGLAFPLIVCVFAFYRFWKYKHRMRFSEALLSIVAPHTKQRKVALQHLASLLGSTVGVVGMLLYFISATLLFYYWLCVAFIFICLVLLYIPKALYFCLACVVTCILFLNQSIMLLLAFTTCTSALLYQHPSN
ncbi:MAG: hypothetical protein SPL05_03780 [Eubacteriales bacterium]|nr:hypothetical protein [Eubacteriales bacterium]